MKLPGTVALCLIVAACGGRSVRMDNRFERQTVRYLDLAYEEMLAGRGYEPTGEVFQGALYERSSENIEVGLEGGESYAFLGACDEDCTDVDLFLFDDYDDEVARDVATDDFPVIRYTPRRDGRYRIRVRMYDCDAEPCFFAVGVYTRD